MRVEPLTSAHLEAIALQPTQALWRAQLPEGGTQALVASGEAWAAVHDGRVLACLGVLDHGSGVGHGWGLLAADLGRLMPGVTRAVRRYLTSTRYRRIEIKVAANFPPAQRWAGILGFRFEGVARAYCDDGSDAQHWALVRI